MIFEFTLPIRDVSAFDCPYPEALAVLEGINPGWVFVDDPKTPKTALVWAQGIQGFYLVGEPDNAGFLASLNTTIDQALTPRLQALGVTWFEVSGGERWDPVIERTFHRRELILSQQWVYTLEPDMHQAPRQPEISTDGQLSRIDRRLLFDHSQNKGPSLISKIKQFWRSENEFMKAGFGYVLAHRDEIASLCFSGFVVGHTHAIDIETRVSHRRKGYAEAVAKAFIAECRMRNLQPYWDCMAENEASTQLAHKLGLTRSHTYTLYSFPLQS